MPHADEALASRLQVLACSAGLIRDCGGVIDAGGSDAQAVHALRRLGGAGDLAFAQAAGSFAFGAQPFALGLFRAAIGFALGVAAGAFLFLGAASGFLGRLALGDQPLALGLFFGLLGGAPGFRFLLLARALGVFFGLGALLFLLEARPLPFALLLEALFFLFALLGLAGFFLVPLFLLAGLQGGGALFFLFAALALLLLGALALLALAGLGCFGLGALLGELRVDPLLRGSRLALAAG
ncbi:MAG TPA: hypothetical protein VGK73_25065 [Polyangiaceae bacterium]